MINGASSLTCRLVRTGDDRHAIGRRDNAIRQYEQQWTSVRLLEGWQEPVPRILDVHSHGLCGGIGVARAESSEDRLVFVQRFFGDA